ARIRRRSSPPASTSTRSAATARTGACSATVGRTSTVPCSPWTAGAEAYRTTARMQLPPALRAAIDRELERAPPRDLTIAAERLSRRYRAEIRDGRLHIDDGLAARAYLTTRLPATFAAIAASLAALAEILPGFHPRSVLDIGAGPGTATWAAASTWESVAEAV